MRFRKIHGAGNDFVLLSDLGPDGDNEWSKEAERLCARRTGVGADGLVISRLVSTALPSSKSPASTPTARSPPCAATPCGATAWAAHRDHGFRKMRLRMAGVMHEAVVTRRLRVGHGRGRRSPPSALAGRHQRQADLVRQRPHRHRTRRRRRGRRRRHRRGHGRAARPPPRRPCPTGDERQLRPGRRPTRR